MKLLDIKTIFPDNGGVVFLDPSAKVMFTCDNTDAQSIGETLLSMITALSLDPVPATTPKPPATLQDLIK